MSSTSKFNTTDKQPISAVQWVKRDDLKPNNYNPNKVAPPELKLLKISILEDGWTQPIVANPDNTIVDGFHRWTVSGHKEIRALTGGLVPVVFTQPDDEQSMKMATVRHNRARGTHLVVNMAEIVAGMVKEGMALEEICERMQMEKEEVIRLSNRQGIPKTSIISDAEFGKSWEPE